VKKFFIKPGKNFAFIQFGDYHEAEKAMIGCRNTPFRGKTLSIEIYEQTKQRK
jgi:hypothetical protein